MTHVDFITECSTQAYRAAKRECGLGGLLYDRFLSDWAAVADAMDAFGNIDIAFETDVRESEDVTYSRG